MGSRALLVGNRLALVGALLYLSEWIAIAFLPAELPTDRLGEDPASIVAAYGEDVTRIALITGVFAFVLLGRVVFVAGLRDALRDAPRSRGLADVALVAMGVSVAIELVSLGLAAPAARIAEVGGDAGAIVALDAASSLLFALVVTPLGVSVLAASLAMLASGLFARWLCWFGIAAGAVVILGGIVTTGGLGRGGTLGDLADGAATGPPVIAFWIWMLATSIVLYRARPRGVAAPAAS
jgi:hypothetical protein